jgi:hypothetical protein
MGKDAIEEGESSGQKTGRFAKPGWKQKNTTPV